MTGAEKIAALVHHRLEQADEALAAAELNLANGLQRSAINRASSAMFYAVLALLAERTIETSRHSGAVAQFDLLYVKPQVFPADMSRSLHRAFAHRQAADYSRRSLVRDALRRAMRMTSPSSRLARQTRRRSTRDPPRPSDSA